MSEKSTEEWGASLPTGAESLSRRPTRWERGQTLVVAAVVMVLLVAFLAVVLDVGNIYSQRRRMQNAADAGAMAGVQRLAMDESTASIVQAAEQYVRANGATSYGTQILTRSVIVTAVETFGTFFASVIGVPTFTVSAVAEGGYGFPSVWSGLVPVLVRKDTYSLDTVMEIWDIWEGTPPGGQNVIWGGQRGWANFNGDAVSAQELCDWVEYGYNDPVSVGMWINGTPGEKATVMQAMDEFRTGKTVIVPIFDYTRTKTSIGNGEWDYHICGFGVFSVTNVKPTGHPKYIDGIFRRWIAPEDFGGEVDTGVRVIQLIR